MRSTDSRYGANRAGITAGMVDVRGRTLLIVVAFLDWMVNKPGSPREIYAESLAATLAISSP